jgi:hypothetical protein
MKAGPICIVCNVERALIDVTPVRNRHEMLAYECPKCQDIFRLVVRRGPRELAERISGAPVSASAGNNSGRRPRYSTSTPRIVGREEN